MLLGFLILGTGCTASETVVENTDFAFDGTCVNCHAIRGLQAVARVGPDLTHVGSRATLATGVVDNTPANLQRWIRNAASIKPGVLMPAFQNLSDQELALLADYLESLK